VFFVTGHDITISVQKVGTFVLFLQLLSDTTQLNIHYSAVFACCVSKASLHKLHEKV
jgi:hypothetical protein